MQVKAKLKHLRIAPRKVRLVADLIRKKSVEQAKSSLDFCIKKAARPFKKLLDQAIANAKNNLQLEEKTLRISKIMVDEGPKLKRWRARSKGRASDIQKKSSHITLILEGEKRKKIKQEVIKPEEKKEIKTEDKPEKIKIVKPKIPELKKKIQPRGLKKVFKRKSF